MNPLRWLTRPLSAPPPPEPAPPPPWQGTLDAWAAAWRALLAEARESGRREGREEAARLAEGQHNPCGPAIAELIRRGE